MRSSRNVAPQRRSRLGGSVTKSSPSQRNMKTIDKATGQVSEREVVLAQDECNRPGTNLVGLNALSPVFKGGQRIQQGSFITAGNASQLSDGASASVLMTAEMAAKKGLEPLGICRGMVAAGCSPDEMGIGPVFRGGRNCWLGMG